MPIGPGYTPQNPLDLLQGFQKAVNPQHATADFLSTPIIFNSEDEQFNRYKSSDYAKELGFVPGRDNEELYGRRQTVGNTLSKGLEGAWELGANQFVDGFKGWGRMFDALTHWDASKLYDEGDIEQLNNKQQDVFNKYAIFQTQASKNSLINKQFFGNLLQQSGFTLGTIGQVVAEEALVQLAASALAATGVGAGAGAVLEGIEQAKAAKTVAETAELIEKMGDLYKAPSFLKKVFQRALPSISSTTKAFSEASSLYDVAKAGFGTLYRTAREANMAMTEARMESANTYGQMKGDLINQFVKDNGRGPNSNELDKIEDYTRKAASTNFFSNTAIIGIANRLEFDNILRGFSPSIAAEREAGRGLMDITGVLKEGEGAGTRATQVFDKSFKGVAEAGKTFGTRGALKAAGKLALNHLEHVELVEGIQENLQDISDQSARDYYTKLYGGKTADWASSINEGFRQENNLQGANTFLQGALTGLVTFPVNWAVGKIQNRGRGAAIKAQKGAAIAQANALNSYLRNPGSLINEHVARINLQKGASQGMKDAVTNNDQFSFQNLKDSAFYKMVNSAASTGRFGLLRDRLMDYAQNLTEDEFKKAFPGVDTKGNLQGAVQDLVERAHEINQDLTILKERFRDPFDPTKFKPGTPEHDNEFIRQKAFHDTLEELAYNKYSVRRAKERYQSILNDVASDKEMAGEAFNAFNDLTHRDKVRQKTILQEAQDSVNTSITEAEKAKAQKHLDQLKEWYDSVDELNEYHSGFQGGSIALPNRAYKAFTDYLKSHTKDGGLASSVTNDTVDRNFTKLMDIIRLQDKAAQHIENVNFLANPKGFDKFSVAMGKGALSFLKSMQEKAKEMAEAEAEKEKEKEPVVPTQPGTAPPQPVFTPQAGVPQKAKVNKIKEIEDKYNVKIDINNLGRYSVSSKNENEVLSKDTRIAAVAELDALGLHKSKEEEQLTTPRDPDLLLNSIENDISESNNVLDIEDLISLENTLKDIALKNPDVADRANELAKKAYEKIRMLTIRADALEMMPDIEDKLRRKYPDGLNDPEFVEEFSVLYAECEYKEKNQVLDVDDQPWTEKKTLIAIQAFLDAHYLYVTNLFSGALAEEKHKEFDDRIKQIEKEKEEELAKAPLVDEAPFLSPEDEERKKRIEAFYDKEIQALIDKKELWRKEHPGGEKGEDFDKKIAGFESEKQEKLSRIPGAGAESQGLDRKRLEDVYNAKIQAVIAERDEWDKQMDTKRRTLRPQKEFYSAPKKFDFSDDEEEIMKKVEKAKTFKDLNELIKTLPEDFRLKHASYLQGKLSALKNESWNKKKEGLSPITISSGKKNGKKTYYYKWDGNKITLYTARGTEMTPATEKYDEIVEGLLSRTPILRVIGDVKHSQLYASAAQVDGNEASLDNFISDLFNVLGVAPSREAAQRIAKLIPVLEQNEELIAQELQRENEQRFNEKIGEIIDSYLLDPDVHDKDGQIIWDKVREKIQNSEALKTELTKDQFDLLIKSLDDYEKSKEFISQEPVEEYDSKSDDASLLEQEKRNEKIGEVIAYDDAMDALTKYKATEDYLYSKRFSQKQTTGREDEKGKLGVPKVLGDREVERRYKIKRWLADNFTKGKYFLEIIHDDDKFTEKYDLAFPDDYYKFRIDHPNYKGVIAVLVDKDGNAIKFDNEGKPNPLAKGVFFSLPSYYNEDKGVHKQDEGTDIFKPILGMSWSAFKDYLVRTGKSYRAPVTGVSHGAVIVDYTRGEDLPTKTVVSGKKFEFMTTKGDSVVNPLGQDVGGLLPGATYMFISGNGYPISVNMMTFEQSGLLEPTMNFIKQFLNPKNGLSGAKMRDARTYLKNLILSNESFSGLSIALDQNTDEGQFIISGAIITDLNVIRKFLKDRRVQIKNKLLSEKFTLYRAVDDPVRSYNRYTDFIVDYSTTKLVVDNEKNPLVLNRFLTFDEPVDVTPKAEIKQGEEVPKEPEKPKEPEVKKDETVLEKARREAAERAAQRRKDRPSKLGRPGSELKRSSKLYVSKEPASQKDFEKFLRTFNRTYKGEFSDRKVRSLYNVANSDAWGTWSEAGIILFKGADRGTLYHEAWHEFSQFYLSKEEKDELYKEAQKVFGEDKSREELEEELAEGYREYTLSQKEPSTIIGKFFKWIKDLLDRFFVSRDKIQSLYKDLYDERIERWSPSRDNIEFGRLSRAIKDSNGDNVLNVSDSHMIVRTIDAIMYDYIRSQDSTMSEALNKKGVLDELYEEAYYSINDEVESRIIAIDAGENVEENTQIMQDLSRVLNNWDKVKNYHADNSRTFEIQRVKGADDTTEDNIKVKGDTEDDPNQTPQDVAVSPDAGRNNNLDILESNRISSLDSANRETRALVRGLKQAKVLPDGTIGFENNRWGFPELVNFSKTWNQIANSLAGSMGTDEMIRRLNRLKPRFPEFNELLTTLPKPTEALDEYHRDQLVKFWQDFNRTYVPIKETVVGLDESNSPVFKWDEATKGNVDSITRDFKNNFTASSPKDKFLDDDGDGNTMLSMQLDANGHSEIFTYFNNKFTGSAGKDFKKEFLDLLGLTLSPETYSSDRFNNYVDSLSLNRVLEYMDLVITSGIKITDPITQLSTDARLLGIRVPEGLSDKRKPAYEGKKGIFNKIIGFEARFNQAHASLSMRNAQGNLVYGLSANSYLTIVNNILSDTENYETFAQIVANPFMKHLDPLNNPYAKGSHVLASMFYLDGTPGEGDYGKRKKFGNEFITMQIGNYSGIKFETESGTASEGELTTRMYARDKLVMDINNMFSGACSLMRTGDKALDYYMSLSSWSISGNQKTPIPIGDFSKNFDSTALYDIMANYLDAEMKRISDFQNQNYIGRKLTYFSKTAGSFNLFRDILSDTLKNMLMKEIKAGTDPYKILNKVGTEHQTLFQNDIREFFHKQWLALTRELDAARMGADTGYRWMNRELITQAKRENSNEQAVLRAFIANQFIYHVEQSKLIFGDGAFFKDAHKRFPFATATGTLLIQEEWHDKLHNLQNASLDIPSNMKYIAQEGIANTAIFNDVKFKSIYGELWDKQLRDEIGATESEIRKILNPYGYLTSEQIEKNTELDKDIEQAKLDNKSASEIAEMEKGRHVGKQASEGDGQGWITLPFYRYMKMCQGKWYAQHAAIYERVMRGEEIPLDEMFYFMPVKAQYGGPLAIDGIYAPGYHKFSLMPLIPSMIKGTKLEHINKKMMEQNIGYGLFKSGSKVTELTEDGTTNDNFYDNYDKATKTYDGREDLPDDYQFTKNPIYLHFLKEQVNIAPEVHHDVIFASQMRKLVIMNLFNSGDFIGNSRLESLHSKYLDTVKKLTDIEKEKLFKELAITQKDGQYEIGDMARFADRVLEEAQKRDYNDNVLEFIDYDKNTKTFANPLDASVNAGQIQGLIMSIINNRVVRQLISGDMMVQGASSGTEKYRKATDEEKYEYGDNGLRYYYLKDGRTLSMQVKIPLNGHFLNLLNREDVRERMRTGNISGLEALNQLLKDENWVKDNRESITMVGTRIPVQSLNSMEVMEIAEFLPTTAGDLMIVPSNMVTKSGSDYDIDKVFTFKPVITSRGHILKSSYDLTRDQLYELIKQEKALRKDKFANAISFIHSLRQESKDISKIFSQNRKEIKQAYRTLTSMANYYRNELVRIEEQQNKTLTLLSTLSEAQTTSKTVEQILSEKRENMTSELSSVLAELREIAPELQYIEANYHHIYDIKSENKQAAYNAKEELIRDSFNSHDRLRDLYEQFHGYKGAIQNSLIDTMNKIITDKDNFKLFISPNDTDQVEPISNYIKSKTYRKDWLKNKDEDEFTGTDMYTWRTQLEKFQSGLIGKRTLGIAAVNNTFLQLFMEAGLRAMPRYNEEEREYDDMTGEIKRTYMTEVETIINLATKDGDTYNMSALLDEDGIQKSKFTEQMINAYVDVLNKDFIFYANAGLDIAGTMFYLKTLGVSTPRIFYFMNHPSVRAWVDRENIRKSKIVQKVINEDEDSLNSSINAIVNGTMVDGSFVQGTLQADVKRQITGGKKLKGALLREAVAKYAQGKPRVFSTEFLRGRIGTNEKIRPEEELLILNELANMKTQGEIFRKAQSSLNFDTNKSASQFDAQDKLSTWNKVEKHALFNKSALEYVRDKSVVSSFSIQKMIIDIMDKVFPVTGNKTFVKRAVELLEENRVIFKPQSTKDRVIRSYRNDLITFILTNYASSPDGNGTLGNYVHNTQNMFETMGERLRKMQAKYTDARGTYKFFNDLALNRSKKTYGSGKSKQASKIINIELFRSDNSVPAQNSYIEEWRKLATTGPQELQDFFKDLAIFAYFQSGLTRSNISFTDLIPNELVSSYLREGIDKYQADVNARGIDTVLDTYTSLFRRENKIFNPMNKEDDYRFKDYRIEAPASGTSTTRTGTPTAPQGTQGSLFAPTSQHGITFEEERTTGYKARTVKNASADATIAIAVDFNSAGEKLTKTSVESQKKIYIPIDFDKWMTASDDIKKQNIKNLVFAFNQANLSTLNIAGNGIYTMKGKYTQAQVDEATYELLKAIIEHPDLKNKNISIRTGGQTGFDEAGAKAGVRLGLSTHVLAPKGWTFRDIAGNDISSEQSFKGRFAPAKQDTSAVEIKEGRGEVYFLARNNVKTSVTSENVDKVGTIYWNGIKKISKEQAKEWLSAKKAKEEGGTGTLQSIQQWLATNDKQGDPNELIDRFNKESLSEHNETIEEFLQRIFC